MENGLLWPGDQHRISEGAVYFLMLFLIGKDTKQKSDHFYLCLREISKVGNNNKLIIERE